MSEIPRDPTPTPPLEMVEAPTDSRPQVYTHYKLPPQDACCNKVIVKFEMTEQPKNIGHDLSALDLRTNSFADEEQQRRHQSPEHCGKRARTQINVKIPPPSPPFDITSPPTQSSNADLQLLESCILKCFPDASRPPLSSSSSTGTIEVLHALPRPLSGNHDSRPFLRSSEDIERSVSSLGSSYDSNVGCSSDSLLSFMNRREDTLSSTKGNPTLRYVVTRQSSLVARHRQRHLHSRRKNSRRDGRLVEIPYNSPLSQEPSRATPGAILSTATALFTKSQSSLMKLYLSQKSTAFSTTSFGSCSESESSNTWLDAGADKIPSGSTCATATECNCPSDGIKDNLANEISSTRRASRIRQLFEQRVLRSNSTQVEKRSNRLRSTQRLSGASAGTPTSLKAYFSAESPGTATPALRKDQQSAFSAQLLSSPILPSLPTPPALKPCSRFSFSLKVEKALPKRLSKVTTSTTSQSPAQRPLARPLLKTRHFSFLQKRASLYDNTSSSYSDNQISRIEHEREDSGCGERGHRFTRLEDDKDAVYENGGTSIQGFHRGSSSGSEVKGVKPSIHGPSSMSLTTMATEKKSSSVDHHLSSDRKRPHLLASWARVMTSWSSVSLHLPTKTIPSRHTSDVLREPGTAPSTYEPTPRMTRYSFSSTGDRPLMWTPDEERFSTSPEPLPQAVYGIQTCLQSSSTHQRQDGGQPCYSSGKFIPVFVRRTSGTIRENCNCYRNGRDKASRLSCLFHKELPNLPSGMPSSLISAIAPSPALDMQPASANTNKKNRSSTFFTTALSSLTSVVGGIGKDNSSKQTANCSRQIDIHNNRSRRQSIMSFVGSKRTSRRSLVATATPVNKSQRQLSPQDTMLSTAATTPTIGTSSSHNIEKHQGKEPSARVLRAIKRHAAGQTVCSATPCFPHPQPGRSVDATEEELIPSRTRTRLTQPRRSVLQQRLYQNPQLASSPQLLSMMESFPLSSSSLPAPDSAASSYSCSDLRLARYGPRSLAPNEHVPELEKPIAVPKSNIGDLRQRQDGNTSSTLEIPGSALRCEKEKIPFFEPFHATGRHGSGYVSFHFDLSHLEERDKELAHVGAEHGSMNSALPSEKPAGSDLTSKATPPVPLFYRVFQRPYYLSSMPTLVAPLHSIVVPSISTGTDPSLATSPANISTGARSPPLQPRPKVPPLKFALKSPHLLPKPLLSPEFLSSIQTSLGDQSQDFFYGQTGSPFTAMLGNENNEIDFGSERGINSNKVSSSVDISSATAFAILPRKNDLRSADIVSGSPSSIASAVDSITRLNLIGVSDTHGPGVPSSHQRRGPPPPPPPPRRLVQRGRSVLEGSDEEDEGEDRDDTTDNDSDEATDPFRTLQQHLEIQQLQQPQHPNPHHSLLKLQGQAIVSNHPGSTAFHSPQLHQQQLLPTPLRFKDRILGGRHLRGDDGGSDGSETRGAGGAGFSTVSLPAILDSRSKSLHALQSPMGDIQDQNRDKKLKWGWSRIWGKY